MCLAMQYTNLNYQNRINSKKQEKTGKNMKILNKINQPILKISLMLTLSAFSSGAVIADGLTPEKIKEVKKIMMHQMSMMTPELQKKVKALSPKTQKLLMQILSQHTRYSDKITLRQVMHEVLSDYQGMVTGIMTDNPVQTAASARRLANHRIPAGGLLPYLGLENITDEKLAVLDAFNSSVEGEALKAAAAADAGDMGKAAIHMSNVTNGCTSCHNVFRGQPGVSNLVVR